MKKILLGATISALMLLNTACSPKEDNATTTITSSSIPPLSSLSVSSEPTVPVNGTEPTNPPASEFQNTYWKLILLNETEVAATENQREPHLTFTTSNQVTGSDGCNTLSADYTLEGETIRIGEITSTKMACTEGGDLAQAFTSTLGKVANYRIHSDQLELKDESGLVLARFAATTLP